MICSAAKRINHRIPRGSNITKCPYCETSCTTVKSNQLDPMVREVTYLCKNPECGALFVAQVTPVRVIDPPPGDDHAVNLPRSATTTARGNAK